jgi:hypothetical protein
MVSVRTCLIQDFRACQLQEGTFYGVNKYLYVTRRHVIWGQSDLVCYKKLHYTGSKKACLILEGMLYVVSNELSDS